MDFPIFSWVWKKFDRVSSSFSEFLTIALFLYFLQAGHFYNGRNMQEKMMDMGTISAAGIERDGFLGEVDFKWLMAGRGCWIDPERLHSDRAYASDCLKAALNSSCDVLRNCACFLQVELLSCM